MAVDKLVDSTQLNSDLTSVANAIRTKGGTSAQLSFPSDFVSAIGAISTGGSGDFAMLKNVTLSEAVHAIQVDYESAWEDYDRIFIVADIALDSADYVYPAFNTDVSSKYLPGSTTHHWMIAESEKTNNVWTNKFMDSSGESVITNDFPSYFHIRCYTSGKNFSTDTTVKVFGGKLS